MIRTGRTVGVDVGGTKVAVGILDGNNLLETVAEPTERDSAEALIEQICRMVRSFGQADAVGIGVPSVIRLSDGMLISSTHIDALKDIPLRHVLAERLALPVKVDNDGNLSALCEAYDEELKLIASSVACVTVGTGVGGGITVEGRPLHGSTTSAFELGHIIVAANLLDGAPAGGKAPLPEALESWASGTSLNTIGKRFGFEDAKTTSEAALAGDPKAIEAVRILGERVGVGVAALITLLEPDVVTIGGGASSTGELLVGPTRETAARLLLPGLGDRTEIRVASYGPRAGVRGAAILARLEENEFPS